METIIEQTEILTDKLGLTYLPVGLMLTENKPDNALSLKTKGNGCIAPLIFSASKGKIVAIDKNTTGYPCSAFYLGYQQWIFNGIEYFLSDGPMPGRECERFTKTPQLAKDYITSLIPKEETKGAVVFKPIKMFEKSEKPEIVILFANPDQMSAIVFLLHYNKPELLDRVVTGFASSCAAVTTFPLKFAREGQNKAFWGFHDISTRPTFPADITSIAMPLPLYQEMCNNIQGSFLFTSHWDKVLTRIIK
ncbi:MAG: DUF169 domain-containing protein [bacterium]